MIFVKMLGYILSFFSCLCPSVTSIFLIFYSNLKKLTFQVIFKFFFLVTKITQEGLCFTGCHFSKICTADLFPVLTMFPVSPLSIIHTWRNLTSGISRSTCLVISSLDAPVLYIKFRRGKLLSFFVPGSHLGTQTLRKDFG